MSSRNPLVVGFVLIAVSLASAKLLAVNLATFSGGHIVRMDYASDGVSVGGTFDFRITGLLPSTGTIGFLNVVADMNFNNNIEPQEWIVRNVPLPLSPVLTDFPLMSSWFDADPFELAPGAPYRAITSLQPSPIPFPNIDPTWHQSIVPAQQFLWGGNDPAGQSFTFLPPILPPPVLPNLEAFKRSGVPDIAQQTNECGPTSAANSLRWLADVHGFGPLLPASNDDLIRGLMRAMTGSDARPFPGLTGDQLYEGKKKYVNDRKLPIVVKGGNTSEAASGANAFKFIKEELAAGEDVEFLIAWPGGGSHWVTAVGYGVLGDRLFLEVNDPDDGKTGPVDWELKPDGTFVNPRGKMLWAVSESHSPIFEYVPPPGGSRRWTLATWSAPGFPDALLHQAHFSGGGIEAGVGLVELDGDRTVNAISFYNLSGSYEFVSPLASTLHLDDGYGDGTIRHDSPATNSIGVRIASPTTLWVDLYHPDGTLRLGKVDTPVLRTNGPGTLEINENLGPAPTTSVYAGAKRTQFNSAQNLRELNLNDGATVVVRAGGDIIIQTEIIAMQLTSRMDLTDNRMVVNPPSGPSPLEPVRLLLVSGYNGGSWDGEGINTSFGDAANFALGFAELSDPIARTVPGGNGESIGPSSVLIRFTRYGDADLNGITNIGDFSVLASNFNGTGNWSDGDFNFDQFVGISDFALLAGNFNLFASDARARAVPEPWTIGIVGGAVPLLMRRRTGA